MQGAHHYFVEIVLCTLPRKLFAEIDNDQRVHAKLSDQPRPLLEWHQRRGRGFRTKYCYRVRLKCHHHAWHLETLRLINSCFDQHLVTAVDPVKDPYRQHGAVEGTKRFRDSIKTVQNIHVQ